MYRLGLTFAVNVFIADVYAVGLTAEAEAEATTEFGFSTFSSSESALGSNRPTVDSFLQFIYGEDSFDNAYSSVIPLVYEQPVYDDPFAPHTPLTPDDEEE